MLCEISPKLYSIAMVTKLLSLRALPHVEDRIISFSVARHNSAVTILFVAGNQQCVHGGRYCGENIFTFHLDSRGQII